MKGITQPSEGNVKSWPRLSSGSLMKIHNQKSVFFVYRERKRENRDMKMDKVSPGFTDQPVQGFWSSITDLIQLNPGTGLTVNLSWKIRKKFGPWLVSVQVEFGLLRLVAAGTVFKEFRVSKSDLSRSNCLGRIRSSYTGVGFGLGHFWSVLVWVWSGRIIGYGFPGLND